MKKVDLLNYTGLVLVVAIWVFICGVTTAYAADQVQVETIVAIRHGETSPGGLGQLSCRGLNRALALPKILISKYGEPNYIFAPNPSQKNRDNGKDYSYVRPLVTIEPTAIRLTMPVNTQIGYTNIPWLQQELAKPKYANAMIFIAWEHGYLATFAKNMVKAYGGNPAVVPKWPNHDYESIYVIRVRRQDGHASVSFREDNEGLSKKISNICPSH